MGENAKPHDPLRILLVVRGRIVRSAMRALLDESPGLRVVAEAATDDDALRLLNEIPIDVVVSGGGGQMPEKLANHIADTLHARIPVVVISRHIDPANVLPAVRSPVSAYLGVDVDPESLVLALRAVQSGLSVFSNEVRTVIVPGSHKQRSGARAPLMDRLTSREQEVLDLMAQGLSNKEISACLGIGLRTTEMHVGHIVAKGGFHSRVEAIIHAVRSN